MRHTLAAGALTTLLLAPGFASAQLGSDYFYRSPTVTETCTPGTLTLIDANERQRNRFFAGIVNAMLARPHPLSFPLFPIDDDVGFLYMLHMLGFVDVTISDGAGYTHHFMIVAPPDMTG